MRGFLAGWILESGLCGRESLDLNFDEDNLMPPMSSHNTLGEVGFAFSSVEGRRGIHSLATCGEDLESKI